MRLIADKPKNRAIGLFSGPLIRACFCSEAVGAACGRLQAGHPKAARNHSIRRRRDCPADMPAADWAAHPLNPSQPKSQPFPAQTRLGSGLGPAILRRFRYRFDSSQARKTVRWGHFSGLEFAPVFAAKPRRCWQITFRLSARKRPATIPFGTAAPALPTCLLPIGRPIRSIYSISRSQSRKRVQHPTRPRHRNPSPVSLPV